MTPEDFPGLSLEQVVPPVRKRFGRGRADVRYRTKDGTGIRLQFDISQEDAKLAFSEVITHLMAMRALLFPDQDRDAVDESAKT